MRKGLDSCGRDPLMAFSFVAKANCVGLLEKGDKGPTRNHMITLSCYGRKLFFEDL